MTLDEYQRAALRTRNPALTGRDFLLDAAAGLAEEAGEVLGLIRKSAFQNRHSSAERLRDELGDALWCLAATAEALGFSLEDVARANIDKLQARHPGGFTPPAA